MNKFRLLICLFSGWFRKCFYFNSGFSFFDIPFGDLEKEGVVTVKGTGFTSMNVEGFKEVYEEAAEEIQTDNDRHFKVSTLAGIVILKLIAWDDRSEMRGDDIYDIADIINNYFHFNSEAIWEKHSDLFSDDIELEEVASHYLGRQISKVISRNPKLTSRITGILERGLTDSNSNKLDELLARKPDKTITFCRSIIAHILTGIKETSG